MGRFERRWRAASGRNWAILIACVALVVVAMWIALGERARPGVILLPTSLRPAAVDVSIVSATSEESTAAQTLIPQPRIDHSGQVEVCGVGWVDSDAEHRVDPAVLGLVDGLEAELGRLLAALTSSDDAFERAAMLWLQALRTTNGGIVVANQADTCEGEACAFMVTIPADGPLERLAQQATATRDPRVYSLAFKACRGTKEGSCSLLKAARWAQLDGDNGDPWLYVLAEAAARKDTAQMEEAAYRIGGASRVDMRFFAIPRAIAEHAGSGDAGLQAANALAILAIGGMAALPFPSIEPMTRRCRGTELGDANRRQRCDAMASALAERSDNMFYAGIGASMGRQLGWSDLRIDAVRSLSNVLQESLPTQAIDPLTWSCKSIATVLKRVSRQGVVGETGFAREWIAASGTTVERYAASEPERRQRRAAAHRAAASAAEVAEAAASAASLYSATPPPAR